MLARAEWLGTLPSTIDELTRRWSLTIGDIIDHDDVSCAWVGFATRADGTRVVLKIGMPHMKGRDEIGGLRFWNGDAVVRLLAHDTSLNAMLLERCEPGTSLRALPEAEQDVVFAGLLRRLWPPMSTRGDFRPLSEMIEFWKAARAREVLGVAGSAVLRFAQDDKARAGPSLRSGRQ